MNELIKINDNNTISGRDLYDFLQINSNYTTWFERMCEYGFTEGVDYFPKMEDRSDGKAGKHKMNHDMTISMAKEISMIQRNERGKQARLYFIEVENRWKESQKPKTTAELLVEHAQAYLEHERRMAKIEVTQKEQEQRLLEVESKQMTIDKSFYTIAGYANLKGFKGISRKLASDIGRKASGLSRRRGYEIGDEYDARYGKVHTYHEDMLKEVFSEMFE